MQTKRSAWTPMNHLLANTQVQNIYLAKCIKKCNFNLILKGTESLQKKE